VLASRRGDRRKSPLRADRHLVAGARCSALRRGRERARFDAACRASRGFAVAARLLWEQAEVVRGDDEAKLTQLEAATEDGSVFIVREAEQTLAAVTSPEPTAGLVFYDLRSALRSAGEKPKPKKRRAPAKKSTPKAKPSGSS